MKNGSSLVNVDTIDGFESRTASCGHVIQPIQCACILSHSTCNLWPDDARLRLLCYGHCFMIQQLLMGAKLVRSAADRCKPEPTAFYFGVRSALGHCSPSAVLTSW